MDNTIEYRSIVKDASTMDACGCMGPQNGEPYCPCRMREFNITKKNGRWIEPEKDLGAVELVDLLGIGAF